MWSARCEIIQQDKCKWRFFLSNSCCNKSVWPFLFSNSKCFASGVRLATGHIQILQFQAPDFAFEGHSLNDFNEPPQQSMISRQLLGYERNDCGGNQLRVLALVWLYCWCNENMKPYNILYDIIWVDLHFCVRQLSTFWRPTKSYKLSRSTYTIPQIWLDGVFWQVPGVLGLGCVDRIVGAGSDRIRHDGSSISHPCLFGAEFLHNTGEDVTDVLFVFVMFCHFLNQRTSIIGDPGSG